MIMALVCCADTVHARVGGSIFAWDSRTGRSLWQKQEHSLPKLPTMPTHLLYSKKRDVIFVGVGNMVLALNAESSNEVFRIASSTSLRRLILAGDSSLLISCYSLSSEFFFRSWDSKTGRKLCEAQISRPSLKVNCTLCDKYVLLLGTVYGNSDSPEGSVEAWDTLSGEALWSKPFLNPVTTLRCSKHGVLYAGGWGEISAFSLCGAFIWATEFSGIASSLTLVMSFSPRDTTNPPAQHIPGIE